MKTACFDVKSPTPSSDSGSRRCFCAVLLCVFLLSGCDILKGLGLGGDEGDDRRSADPVSQEPAWKGDLAAGEKGNPSIKAKFGIELEGKAGVDAAFHQLKAFISNGGLEADPPVIRTGDWIDLEGGLGVAAYDGTDEAGGGGFILSAGDSVAAEGGGTRGRLIVVGINSFRSGKGAGGQYAVIKNDGVGHVVFQFQNAAVTRRMNPESIGNTGGYAASEMRKYLVKVGGDNESGKFLAGLVAAGVPEGVLWAPARYVANGGSGATKEDEIKDILWLPTEWEMFGSQAAPSATCETEGNQARLEYYNSDGRRKKYFESDLIWYWEASPYSGDSASFCAVYRYGHTYYNGASSAGGVAPAFCVR
jgi:hypothetical protein